MPAHRNMPIACRLRTVRCPAVTPDLEALRRAELVMLDASSRAAADLIRAVDDLLAAGSELAALAGPSWGDAVERWHQAVERGIEATEATEAYQQFPPRQWWP